MPAPLLLLPVAAPVVITAASFAYRSRLGRRMRAWFTGSYDGTVRSLIRFYWSDPTSPVHKNEPCTQDHYRILCRRLERDCGSTFIADLTAREITRLYQLWSDNGAKVHMGHSVVCMLRIVSNFGATLLEDDDCNRLAAILHKMRFPMGKARKERMTHEQVTAVIREAHQQDQDALALAQTIAYATGMRQKDIIGETLSASRKKPGLDIGDDKIWRRGIIWPEIDGNLVLRHITSKKGKPYEVPLLEDPMMVAELLRAYPDCITREADGRLVPHRELLPTDGPIIICERTQRPFTAVNFRKCWRTITQAAGLPDNIRQMDTRATVMTEADEADVPTDQIRQHAGHTNASTTAGYIRNSARAARSVLRARVAKRPEQVNEAAA